MTIQDHRQWLLKKEESLKRGQVDPERLQRKTADGFFFWLANRIFVPLTSRFCLGYNKWGKKTKQRGKPKQICLWVCCWRSGRSGWNRKEWKQMICHSFPWTRAARMRSRWPVCLPTQCHVNNTLIETLSTLLCPCNNTAVGANSPVFESTFAPV